MVLRLILSALTLLAQAILLKEFVGIEQELKKEEREEAKGEKNVHQDIPEWVENFIDGYLANSEKNIHQ